MSIVWQVDSIEDYQLLIFLGEGKKVRSTSLPSTGSV